MPEVPVRDGEDFSAGGLGDLIDLVGAGKGGDLRAGLSRELGEAGGAAHGDQDAAVGEDEEIVGCAGGEAPV